MRGFNPHKEEDVDNTKLLATIEKLRQVRTRDDLKAPPSNILKTELAPGVPLTLRQYQVQGILHLLAMPRFVLGDDTGLGKCVTGDTLIKTTEGLVPIKDLNPSVGEPDTFVPFTGSAKAVIRNEIREIKNFYYGGVKPTVKVRTRRGYEIEGSQVHPLLVRSASGEEKWVKMYDLKEGDVLCLDRSVSVDEERPVKLTQISQGHFNEKEYRVPQELDLRFARLLGYVVSEGWFNHDHHFNVAQSEDKNPEICRDIEECFATFSDYKPKYSNGTYSISSSYLIRFLEAQGLSKGVAKDKAVPECILKANSNHKAEFLRALFESEGHVSKDSIEISSASLTLLKQVQAMLLNFGVLSTRRKKEVKGYDHTYWKLTITGSDTKLFLSQIGFISSRKVEALVSLASKVGRNTNLDTVPHTKEIFESYRLKIAHPTKHGSSFVSTLGHIRAGRRNPSYDFILKCFQDVQEDESLEEILENNYFYDPIVEITHSKAEVYDL